MSSGSAMPSPPMSRPLAIQRCWTSGCRSSTARRWQPGQHDAFFLPDAAGRDASLFDHCVLALDRCLALTGRLGLPLIGTGDWNDGMNRVGENGRGESVWLGWFLLRTLADFAPLAEARDPALAARLEDQGRSPARSTRGRGLGRRLVSPRHLR